MRTTFKTLGRIFLEGLGQYRLHVARHFLQFWLAGQMRDHHLPGIGAGERFLSREQEHKRHSETELIAAGGHLLFEEFRRCEIETRNAAVESNFVFQHFCQTDVANFGDVAGDQHIAWFDVAMQNLAGKVQVVKRLGNLPHVAEHFVERNPRQIVKLASCETMQQGFRTQFHGDHQNVFLTASAVNSDEMFVPQSLHQSQRPLFVSNWVGDLNPLEGEFAEAFQFGTPDLSEAAFAQGFAESAAGEHFHSRPPMVDDDRLVFKVRKIVASRHRAMDRSHGSQRLAIVLRHLNAVFKIGNSQHVAMLQFAAQLAFAVDADAVGAAHIDDGKVIAKSADDAMNRRHRFLSNRKVALSRPADDDQIAIDLEGVAFFFGNQFGIHEIGSASHLLPVLTYWILGGGSNGTAVGGSVSCFQPTIIRFGMVVRNERSKEDVSMHYRFPWLVAIAAGFLTQSTQAGNSLMALNRDGKRLLTTNTDNGTVSVVDLAGRKTLREIAVGKQPEAVTWIGSGSLAIATVYAEDKVVIFDASNSTILASIKTPIEPYGVVVDKAGAYAYVTCEYPGKVVEIDLSKRSIAREMDVGPFVRGLALTNDQSQVLVTHFHSGLVSALDLKSGVVVDQWKGQSTDNLCRQIVVHPTLPMAYVPHVRSQITRNQGEGSIFPFVSILELVSPEKSKSRRHVIAMDEYLYTIVTCNPWEIAISPDGKWHYTIFAGTNDMYVSEVLDDNYRYLKAMGSPYSLGSNPRAAVVSLDGNTLYVYNAMDFAVGIYDVTQLPPRTVGSIKVCDRPYSAEIHRGKVLFNLGRQPMTRIKWIACSSCHPDGEGDGRTWQNPEGLRRTTHFFGMSRTYPLHWSADRDEMQDFEHTIRGPLMQGKGLLSGNLPKELGEPIAGRSKDLDALTAYCNKFDHYRISPHAAAPGKLTASAERGKAVFHSSKTQCATCHSGPDFTDQKTHDVGTGGDDATEKNGPKYDTPTLLRCYRNLSYLHHGKAKTLKEVLTTQNHGDQHGKTTQLSAGEIDDLIAYLKSLPYELPVVPATVSTK